MDAVRSAMLAYFIAAGYPQPQLAALDRYVASESSYDHLVQSWSGACLFQWAGSRRRRVTNGGRCPPLKVQLAIADQEIRSNFPCFLRASNPYAVFRRTFGRGGSC